MKNNIFQKARIKLTLYYIGIMAVILVIFSSALIFTVEHKIRRGFREKIIVRDELVITETTPDPIDSTSDEIEFIIFVIDGLLLVIIGFSSYVLAGKTLKPIKEALETQKKFSADASHDLRTPLAIITTESEVSLQNKNASTKELRETIESNLEETKKMSKLVNDLLLISRGDNQATLHSFTSTDLHNFLERIVTKLQPQAEKKELKLNLCEYKKIMLNLDIDNFERAVSNIIQNAIKYRNKGDVSIDLKEESNAVKISISDTGIGIDKKDLPFVFDRFYKAENSRNDSSGSGLGLPIAKLIIEEHKGAIEIESVVNKGTTVTITMPRK